jgi:hypothetical protein
MEKKIEDYLHLYLGCECVCTEKEGLFKLVGITDKAFLEGDWSEVLPKSKFLLNPKISLKSVPFSDLKLALIPKFIPLKDDEMMEMIRLSGKNMETSMEGVRYALSLGKDLFGLIEAGLAIDKTKLPTQ